MSADSPTLAGNPAVAVGRAEPAPRSSPPVKLSARRCPACGSGNVRRSSLRGGERDAHKFRSPYRCRACKTRFWTVSRGARVAFAAAGLGVLGVALLAMALALLIQSGPDPVATSLADAEPLPMEIALMPDQFVNETRRLQVRATAPLPPPDRRSAKR